MIPELYKKHQILNLAVLHLYRWSRETRLLKHLDVETLRRVWAHRASQDLEPRDLDHRAVPVGRAVLVATAQRPSKLNC